MRYYVFRESFPKLIRFLGLVLGGTPETPKKHQRNTKETPNSESSIDGLTADMGHLNLPSNLNKPELTRFGSVGAASCRDSFGSLSNGCRRRCFVPGRHSYKNRRWI
jgi:hypothetical protein